MGMLRIGIIGAGSIAPHHINALKAAGGIDIVGIASRTLGKAQVLAGLHNIKYASSSIKDLIGQTAPDALMVLVSPEDMKSVVEEALPYHLPLFIEKPAGLSAEDNHDLLEKARQQGVEVMVGFNRRYYSVFHQGLAVIKKHGPLLGVSITGHERIWRQEESGNAEFKKHVLPYWIFANSVHTIDLLRFFGGEVSDLKVITHRYKLQQGDQIGAVMTLSCGAIGQYSSHWYSPGGWSATLFGDGVTVEFKPLEQGRWTDRNFKTYDITADIEDAQLKPGFYGQALAFKHFVDSGEKPWPLQDLEGSYKTMRLAADFVKATA